MNLLFADDLDKLVGVTTDLGSYTPAGEEIQAFASHWDPQTFHTDPDHAATGFFGEIIASGIHTLAVYQRLSALAVYRRWAVLAGRRLTSVEFIAPVTADLTLRGSLVLDKIEHGDSDRSLVFTSGGLVADFGPVMSVTSETYVHQRVPIGENP